MTETGWSDNRLHLAARPGGWSVVGPGLDGASRGWSVVGPGLDGASCGWSVVGPGLDGASCGWSDVRPRLNRPSRDWSDVRPRVAALAARSGDGADPYGDRFREPLEPPLTTDELAELEAQIGLRLPADYRAFVLEAGRGGTGLFSPRRVDGRWTWTESPTRVETLVRPFAHIRGFLPDGYLRERPMIEGTPDLWGEVPDDLPEDAAHGDGLLYLSHLGCALWMTLVMSGPSRGQMWTDRCADGEGFHPEQNADGSRMTFTDWYRHRLHAAEAGPP
ncbi:SMI1/KNR4 family protein [Actinoplanes philippinensis]|uniref:SMI1/KNR4 family protein n=1 Tax=Actinoplanes philippinensis TaxID=35752 RepID=UPI0034008A46